jgi:hypothetical protein
MWLRCAATTLVVDLPHPNIPPTRTPTSNVPLVCPACADVERMMMGAQAGERARPFSKPRSDRQVAGRACNGKRMEARALSGAGMAGCSVGASLRLPKRSPAVAGLQRPAENRGARAPDCGRARPQCPVYAPQSGREGYGYRDCYKSVRFDMRWLSAVARPSHGENANSGA